MLVKGAVERMLDLCSAQLDADGNVRPLDRDAVLQAAGDLARQGLRVLATAVRTPAGPEEFDPDQFGEDSVDRRRWC